jgi:hypothetical protein
LCPFNLSRRVIAILFEEMPAVQIPDFSLVVGDLVFTKALPYFM